MESLNTWLINGMYIMFIIAFIFAWLLYLRAYYAKKVIGKVLCEFITAEGNGRSRLLPVKDGMVTVKPKSDKDDGKMYAIADVATYQVDYPNVPKWIPISTKVKKMVCDEDSWEPLTNRRGQLILSPVRLYNLLNENFSKLGVAQAREEAEIKRIVKSSFSINWTYVFIGIAIVAIVAAVYFVIQNQGAIGVE